MNKERILIAAIWKKEYLSKPPFSSLPVNITTGIVFKNFRHEDVILDIMHHCNQNVTEDDKGYVFGFLTSYNRFVDRKEAMLIAKNAKQLLPDVKKYDQLYSENLY